MNQYLLGGLGLGAAMGAGAGIGALSAPKCNPDTDTMVQSIVCGPKSGAIVGGAGGVVIGGIAGLLVAALVPKYRTAGLTAAGIVGGVMLIGTTRRLLT
jgi:hypothetical protein